MKTLKPVLLNALLAALAIDSTAALAASKAAAPGRATATTVVLVQPVTVAAWTAKPSWYIVAGQDRMIDPAAERALAKRMKAKTTELASSHVPMVSQPAKVAEVIAAAAASLR